LDTKPAYSRLQRKAVTADLAVPTFTKDVKVGQPPAGQIAAREIEIVRIKGALQRAEQLSDDVAAAIERAL
jgi:hypothetical protein